MGRAQTGKRIWVALLVWPAATACDPGFSPDTNSLVAPLSTNSTWLSGPGTSSDPASDAAANGSQPLSAVLTPPDGDPSDLRVVRMADGRVRVTWVDNSSNEDGFLVQRYDSATGWTDRATLGANVQYFFDTDARVDTVYYYRVQAFNAAGASQYTSQEEVSGADQAAGSSGKIPSVPTNLTATLSATGTVQLAWTDTSSDEDSFSIQRWTGGGTWSDYATAAANVTTFEDTAVTAGATYYYRVAACNSLGCSAFTPLRGVRVPGSGTASTSSTVRISGYVRDGQTGIAGVIVSTGGSGPAAVTNSAGAYSLDVPKGWSGVVAPQHPEYRFDPLSRSYSGVTVAQTAQDYAATSLGNSDSGGTAASSDDQVVALLSALPPLSKPHYSWAQDPEVIDAKGEDLYQYVRITRAVTLSLWFATQSQVETAVGWAFRANAAEPNARPTVIVIHSMPWHLQLEGKVAGTNPNDRCGDPSYDGPEVAESIRWTTERLQSLKQWINGRVPVAAILYDCECWYVNGDPIHDAAMDAKHDLYFQLCRGVFPEARIITWDRGAILPAPSDTGWTEMPYFTLRDSADHFSCYFDLLSDLTLTRETYKRTCEHADNHGYRDVIPWLALGCGSETTFAGVRGLAPTDQEYPLINSWQLGAEINQPWYAQHPERYAPWDRAACVVFYPPAFDPRVPQWGKHFVAYVRGAHAITQLP